MQIKNISSLVKKGKVFYEEYSDTIRKVSDYILTSRKDADESNPLAEEVPIQSDASNAEALSADNVQEKTFAAADNYFDENTDLLLATVRSGIKSPQEATAAVVALCSVANETIKYVADQETRQVEIKAQSDVAIARINAASEIIKTYLDKTFDERSAIFAKQFECVDQALKSGDNVMLSTALNSINSLAASSPFKNLADISQVSTALSDATTVWDI